MQYKGINKKSKFQVGWKSFITINVHGTKFMFRQIKDLSFQVFIYLTIKVTLAEKKKLFQIKTYPLFTAGYKGNH